jgi:hypothetical protein
MPLLSTIGMESTNDKDFSLQVCSGRRAHTVAIEYGYTLPISGYRGIMFHGETIVGVIAWTIDSAIVEVHQLISFRSQQPVQLPHVGPVMLLHLQRHLQTTMHGRFKVGIPRTGQCRRNPIALNCYKAAGFQIVTDMGKGVTDADFDLVVKHYKSRDPKQQKRIESRMRFDIQYKEFEGLSV